MQDTFARARTQPPGQARDDRASCIQAKHVLDDWIQALPQLSIIRIKFINETASLVKRLYF